jgi:hypothetical protein
MQKMASLNQKMVGHQILISSFIRIVTQLLVLMKYTGLHSFPNLPCTRKILREKMLAIKEYFFLFYRDWVSTKKLKTLLCFSSPLVASSSTSRTSGYFWVSEIPIQYSISQSLKCAVCLYLLGFWFATVVQGFFFLLWCHLLRIFTASLHSVLDRFISIEYRPQPTSATAQLRKVRQFAAST